ncbi:hypothetical protein IFR05_012744 [Cadophora sp. M221]|nr:hypothetical protein IFR05_012744 [Cadophora sp. M221]
MRSSDNHRERWGYSFEWTDKHLPADEVAALRSHVDELGSAAFEKLQALAGGKEKGCPIRPELYTILRDHHQEDETLEAFWQELHSVPDWVDWNQIERAQRFFARYALANSTAFALQGFIRENSASPGIAEVFARTGGFAIKNLLSRVIETFTWLIHVTNSLESIQPGGEGHTSTIRVRLLHAAVRQRILKLAGSRPEYFSVEKFGAPVNDLDSMHAISLFCCSPMWDSFPKMGIYPTQQEIVDFIALFRYIAYLTGTPTSYWETPERAKAVMETMLLHELAPNGTSKILAHNFIKWIEDQPPPYLSRGFLEAGCRWMNGPEMCDALGLGRPALYYYVVFAGHNILVSFLAYSQRFIPAFDRAVIKFFRKTLYNAVTDHAHLSGGKGPFDFKFVPQLNTKFGKEVDLVEVGVPDFFRCFAL